MTVDTSLGRGIGLDVFRGMSAGYKETLIRHTSAGSFMQSMGIVPADRNPDLQTCTSIHPVFGILSGESAWKLHGGLPALFRGGFDYMGRENLVDFATQAREPLIYGNTDSGAVSMYIPPELAVPIYVCMTNQFVYNKYASQVRLFGIGDTLLRRPTHLEHVQTAPFVVLANNKGSVMILNKTISPWSWIGIKSHLERINDYAVNEGQRKAQSYGIKIPSEKAILAVLKAFTMVEE